MNLQLANTNMNTATGRVLTIRFTDVQSEQKAAVLDPIDGPQGGDIDVLEVRFRAPDGDIYTHNIPNGEYNIMNPAMQFIAYLGLRPTEIEGTYLDVSGEEFRVPLAATNDGEYVLNQQCLNTGQQRLVEASWFPYDGNGAQQNKAIQNGAQSQ